MTEFGYQTNGFREPPHNLEAEQALLGAILVNNRAYERVSEFLRPEHFADQIHGRIFEACSSLIEEGRQATPVTLKGIFDQVDALEEVGGAQYLVKLAASVVTVINSTDYGREILECWRRRELIEIGEGLVNDAFDRSELESTHIADKTQSALDVLAEGFDARGTLSPLSGSVDSAMEHIRAAAANEGSLLGVSTGLRALDEGTGGLLAPDLVVLAARPSMGKTSLARQIAYGVAKHHGPVAFFSLEMSRLQQDLSLIAALADVSVSDVLAGAVADAMPRIERVSAGIKSVPLFVDDRAGLSVSQVRSACRSLKRKHGLSLVVVDYIQLMRGGGRAENRTQEVGQISQGLKAIAKELGVPVLALSQLSRQVETRDDKHPVLADLRESGAIEQDADQVWFLYREEYYVSKRKPSEGGRNAIEKMADWRVDMDAARHKAEVDVAKRRMGPTGRVELRFYGKTTSFGEPA